MGLEKSRDGDREIQRQRKRETARETRREATETLSGYSAWIKTLVINE